MPLAEFRKNNSKYVHRKTRRRRRERAHSGATIEVQPTFQPLMKGAKRAQPCKAAAGDEWDGYKAQLAAQFDHFY